MRDQHVVPRLDTLTQINLDDLVSSFGWEKRPLLAAMARRIFRKAAETFAAHMVEFDDAVGDQDDLGGPSRLLLAKRYVHALHVEGREHLPPTGPVLFLSNHPGMADTISLCAAIDRSDLKIIAARRPFLASLNNTAKHIFFVDENLGKRVITAHEVATHLRGGGAALTFPAGRIEPDPDLYPGAMEAVSQWADSARAITRLAPDTKIVPVLVRGVIWEKTARHWLTRLKRTRVEREKFAAALQLLAMVSRGSRPTDVHVRFGTPIAVADCNTAQPGVVHQIVIDRMRQLISNVTAPLSLAMKVQVYAGPA